MTAESSGKGLSRDDRQRFALPADDVEPGRSQPKRQPPPRREGSRRLVHRLAWGVATFGISLTLVSVGYRLLVSESFADIAFENGATTGAVALLIGYFSLPNTRRNALDPRRNLTACVLILAATPWSYALSNNLNDAGNWMAPGLNFIFEIALAAGLYQLIARRSPATYPAK